MAMLKKQSTYKGMEMGSTLNREKCDFNSLKRFWMDDEIKGNQTCVI